MPKPRRIFSGQGKLKKRKIQKGPVFNKSKYRNPIIHMKGTNLLSLQEIIDLHGVVEEMVILRCEEDYIDNYLIPCKMRLGDYVFNWTFRPTVLSFPASPDTGNEWIIGAEYWIISELEQEAIGDRSTETWGDTLSSIKKVLPKKTHREISNAMYDEIKLNGSDIVNVLRIKLVALTTDPRPKYEIRVDFSLITTIFGMDISQFSFDLMFESDFKNVAQGINPSFRLKK